MARRKSLFGYTGQLDGVVADRNGLIRMGVGPRDITAARTRENNEEFATASKQGKVIRDALIPLRIQGQLAARMVKVVRQGMRLDETHDRGKRILSSNEARQVLPGFELNAWVNLNTLAPINFIQDGNVLRVEKFGGGDLVAADVMAPEGTTDVQIRGVVSTVDLNPEKLSVKEILTYESELGGDLVLPEMPFEPPVADPLLDPDPDVDPDLDGESSGPDLAKIAAVRLRFYQRVNRKYYRLSDGSYDVARIVAVI